MDFYNISPNISKMWDPWHIDFNDLKQEPVQFVKNEPALLVKEEILEASSQDGNEQQYVEGASTPASTGSVNKACSMNVDELLNIKHELVEMDIAPTVFQHMDMHYTTNKNMNAVPEENTIVNDCHKAMPCSEVKKESIEDKLRDNKTISYKYCSQTKTEEDYDKVHLKSYHGQQKNLQRHLLHQHRGTSSRGFMYDACEGTSRKPQLLVHKKQQQQNKSKTSVITSSAVTGSSNQSRNEIVKQKLFACDFCEKVYSSKTGLYFHKRLHSGVGLSVCHICNAKCSTKSNLVIHLRTHTGEKPYQCDMCNTKFARSTTLYEHMRAHTGEKPYQCDKCNAKFSRSNALTQHMRFHTDEMPYQCDTCDARFAQRDYLIVHMRRHTSKKPYQCDLCDTKFAQRGGLTVHMRVHTGEKPYECDICDARFAQSGALTIHMRVHTGEKPFTCSECRAKFTRKDRLNSHMRRCNTK